MSRTNTQLLRVMVLGRERSWRGGVVEYVRLLLDRLPSDVLSRRMTIGARPGDLAWAGPFRTFADALRLAAECWLRPFDLCHANPSFKPKALWRDGLFLFVLALLGKPCVVLFHGFDRSLAARTRRSRLGRALFRLTYGRARRTMVLASAFREDLAALGVDPASVHVLSAVFDAREIPERSRGVEDPAVLLFLSRMVPGKGALVLVEAYQQLLDEFPGLGLVLAGDGPQRAEALRRARGLNGVELPGHVTGRVKRELLAASDIFVLPTRLDEGCPMALVEAMAAGLAVVAAPAGGIPDAVEDGVNAVLLEDTDPDSVAGALRRLLRDPELRERMSLANRERAFQRFEASAAAVEVADIYRQAARA